ncbi:MAG: flagellar biosynthesis protein FliQ [Spirochaetaceae bacterium]|jgi:flagellar biosynthetic protein FliQ|nr:flagellar biosynthesis protein FliQ [Spirochaetaceae bacterium]
MTIGDAVTLLRGGIFQVLILAAPLLITALVVGLVIAILQAATQIQEQTLTFVPKILAILLILALLGGWMFSMLANYTEELFRMIPSMAA